MGACLRSAGLDRRESAETVTAPCSHTLRAAADGFALVAWPAQLPRLVLLVRVHDVTGAQGAVVAAQMLRLFGAGGRLRAAFLLEQVWCRWAGAARCPTCDCGAESEASQAAMARAHQSESVIDF